MTKTELISGVTKIKVKVFSHNDLDGVSCAIVFKKLYNKRDISFDFSFISYDNIKAIGEFIDDYDTSKNYDFIFITDINLKPLDYEDYIKVPLLNFINKKNDVKNSYKANLFKKMFIIDHHTDTEKVLRDKALHIFDRIEYYNDLEHCAAFQLADFCLHKKSNIWTEWSIGCEHSNYHTNESWVKEYIKLVNDWDLFLWKENNNIAARDLNLLFTNTRREKFIMSQEQKESLLFAFNKTEKTTINDILRELDKEFKRAIKSAVLLPHRNKFGEIDKYLNYVVIKCDENISLICDMIKDELIRRDLHIKMNIGYIVNVSFKYETINFRRINQTVDLAEIANWYGGGGHSFAAGCRINPDDKNQLNNFILPLVKQCNKPSNF